MIGKKEERTDMEEKTVQEEKKNMSPKKNPSWIRRLGLIDKIAVSVDLAIIVAWTIFFLSTEGRAEVLPPRWISISTVLILCLTALLLLVSAGIECTLVYLENQRRIRSLLPVLISFLLFYVLLLLFNWFTNSAHMHYLNCFLSALMITIGSCLLNFWKRK